MPDPHVRSGLFVGLATLDVIHRVQAPPGPDEKITATAQFVAAGGPAANAAVTFAALGGEAVLLTALGTSPIARAIVAELAGVGVRVIDIAEGFGGDAPVSAVAVTESTGDRAVVGGDAAALVFPPPPADELADLVGAADVVLVDGHHPLLALAAVDAARAADRPRVVDAGRWKPVMAELLLRVTDVVASADFRLPGSPSTDDTMRRLVAAGTPVVVATAGRGPVRWWTEGRGGRSPVPHVRAVDTLGAGDVFHGAYAYALARGVPLEGRIAFAARVAAARCEMIGPRSWLHAVAGIALGEGDS
ncbi:PfkB family carbohydrate kinase [Microbacterium sp.]|uniref:PfkB family carbohydrate kinase n=1 Tax=Microbacterium sp. TaxID=51671 RepID=UPI0039E28D03